MTTNESTVSTGPTTVEKLRGLPWGVAWSMSNSVFAQYTFFGSIFVLFLDELGLDKGQIGSLLSLLPFLGIIAIFIASTEARIGYKRVFVISIAARTTTGIDVGLLDYGDEMFDCAGAAGRYQWNREACSCSAQLGDVVAGPGSVC